MSHALLSDVRCRLEGRKMSAHESRKVDKDSASGKSKGNPAVARDICGIGKTGSGKNQIFQHEINEQIGTMPQIWEIPERKKPAKVSDR